MPPKAQPDKKKKANVSEYKDDKGNTIPFEDWISLLRKKYVNFCKVANVATYPSLVDKIRNSIESDDKSLVGVPFPTLTISGVSAAQIPPICSFIELYGKLTKVALAGLEISEVAMQALGRALSASHAIKFVYFINCKISVASFREFFNAVPTSGLYGFCIDGSALTSETLLGIALMVEKYIYQCRQTAQAAIEEASAKHQEELEKIERDNAARKNKKKLKIWKPKKGEVIIFDKHVDDIYYNYFSLRSIVLVANKLSPLSAPALGVLVEKICPYITQVVFRHQEFGAIGLGEIGSGLVRASAKLADQMREKRVKMHAVELETFTGNQFIVLEELEFSDCQIQEDIQAAYGRFGEGILEAGRIKSVVLKDNVLREHTKWLIPSFLLQKSIIKVVLPEKCDSTVIKDLAAKLREHRKAQDDWAKLAKKMAKEAKKAAKLAKKAAKKGVQPQPEANVGAPAKKPEETAA